MNFTCRAVLEAFDAAPQAWKAMGHTKGLSQIPDMNLRHIFVAVEHDILARRTAFRFGARGSVMIECREVGEPTLEVFAERTDI